MTPVINPWLFYWMPVADTVWILSLFALIISTAVVAITWFSSMMELECECEETELYKKLIKLKTKFTVGIVVSVLLLIFIPSEKTITKMIVAQNVTYERVEVVSDTVANVYNDIMALFEGNDDNA